MPPCRSKQKLANVHRATSDIASDQVRVHGFQIGGDGSMPTRDYELLARLQRWPLNDFDLSVRLSLQRWRIQA